MNSALTIFFLFLTVFPSAQTPLQDSRNDFVGRVQSMRIELIYPDDGADTRSGKRHLSALRTFDPNGNLTMSEDFYAYGRLTYGKDLYVYNSSGKLVEKRHEINGAVSKTTYTYNEMGQILKENYHGRIREYIYDSDGRLWEIKQYYLSGSADGKSVMSYDEKGRLVGITHYKAGGAFVGRETKTYDDEGNMISETKGYRTKTYNARKRLLSEVSNINPGVSDYRKEVNEYTDKGQLAKKEIYGRDGLKEKLAYEYEVDSVGNWIKQVTQHWSADGKKRVWETYRIITYY